MNQNLTIDNFPWAELNTKSFLNTSKKHKIKALKNMNVHDIAAAFADKEISHWYRQFQIHSSIMQPVYSNLVNTLTDSVVDIIYNKKISNEIFDFKTLKKIEKHLQLYGDVVLLINKHEAYLNLKETYEVKLIESEFVKISYAKGQDYMFEIETDLGDGYKFVEIWNKATMEKMNILMDGDNPVNLQNHEYTADMNEIEKLEVFPIYKITTDNKIRNCLDLISVVDASLTLRNLGQIGNIPTLMIPNDINLDEADGWIFNNQVEIIKAKLNGIFKIDYDGSNDNYNAPTYQQTDVKTDIFESVGDNIRSEIFNTMKLSPSTLGVSGLGASASADALKQENFITKNTRDSYAIEREEQLNEISENFGVELLKFPSFLEEETTQDLISDYTNKTISLRTYLELRFPHWSTERIDEEIERNNQDNTIDLGNIYQT